MGKAEVLAIMAEIEKNYSPKCSPEGHEWVVVSGSNDTQDEYEECAKCGLDPWQASKPPKKKRGIYASSLHS